jgi:type II secretory pathway pseudopilin PulG
MYPIKDNRRPALSASGFTLVELMVAMSVTFIIIAVTLAAYTFVGRNLTRMANTQRLESASRRAFSIFSKDISTASLVTSASTTQLALTLPTKTVTYVYSGGTLTRTASPVTSPEDGNTTLLTNIDTTATSPFRFNYFDTSGNAITGVASIKEIELTFCSVLNNSADNLKKSSFAAVSPRVALSNRSLLQ